MGRCEEIPSVPHWLLPSGRLLCPIVTPRQSYSTSRIWSFTFLPIRGPPEPGLFCAHEPDWFLLVVSPKRQLPREVTLPGTQLMSGGVRSRTPISRLLGQCSSHPSTRLAWGVLPRGEPSDFGERHRHRLATGTHVASLPWSRLGDQGAGAELRGRPSPSLVVFNGMSFPLLPSNTTMDFHKQE